MNKCTAIFLLFIFINSYVLADVLPYNYNDTTCIPIKLSVTEELSTKNPIIEGQNVKLRVRENTIYNGQVLLKAGETVNAKIETVITSGMNGFPAEIIIDDFEIPNVKDTQLIGVYRKKGQNRCLWVYPLKWALTLIPFVGSLTNFIKGGHAKIKPNDIITIYYYPNW